MCMWYCFYIPIRCADYKHTQECICTPFTFICKQYHTLKNALVLHSPLYANNTTHPRVHLYSIHLYMQTIPYTQECIGTPFTFMCKQYHTSKSAFVLHSPLYANNTIYLRVHSYSTHLYVQTIPHTQECICTPFTFICKQYPTLKSAFILHSPLWANNTTHIMVCSYFIHLVIICKQYHILRVNS